MKINPKYKMRNVAGENIVLQLDIDGKEMNRLISFNSTSVMIWNHLYGKDFNITDIADFLTTSFEIDDQQAMADASEWVDKLKEHNIII